MASNEPVRSILSVEDAELFASKIRPSWELVDDSLRDEIEADLAAPAGATPGPDTIIQGVPTLSIGDDSPPVSIHRVDGGPSSLAAAIEAAAQASGGAASAQANGGAGSAKAGRAPVSATLPDDGSDVEVPANELATAPFPQPSPLRPAKTQLGIGGEGALKAVQPSASGPSSRRAVRAAPAASTAIVPASTAIVPAKAAPIKQAAQIKLAPPSGQSAPSRTQPEDDIQIPVEGTSKGLLLKVGLGVAALIGIAAIGFGLTGGGKTKDNDPPFKATADVGAAAKGPGVQSPIATQRTAAPTASPSAPEPAATQAPAVTAAPTATVAAKEPEPKAKEPEPAKSAAPVAAKEPEPKKAAAPEPKKAAAPEPKKAAAPEPKKAAPPAAPPKKPSGGIIRDSPF